jgi:hypothetical protein
VTISNAATANMACSGGFCAPTAADAVLNVQDLEAMLASGNATVTTTGSGVQAVNIHVNARLTWSTGTTLAFDAFRSIEINSKVAVAGTGGVSLTTNDGGSGGDFDCNGNGRLEFSNLSSTLAINGTAYTLVNSIASLANAIAADPSGAFAFAKNYNAKKDGTYTSSPIATVFTGAFNGLGNTISNLTINDSTEVASVGLFAETGASSTISNIRLVNENVQGGVAGGLVAAAGGLIADSLTTGTVGGNVSGGLVGFLTSVVTRSGSTATVSGGAYAGGLIGEAAGWSITDSWATGNVSGGGNGAGGLVGLDWKAVVKHSWASGQVSGTGIGGGLVGDDESAAIERSHASGAVSCAGDCGGLVGLQGDDVESAKISQSYATGTVTVAPAYGASAGGLVGFEQNGETSNTYALGAVTAACCAGGLVGANESESGYPHPSLLSSYATGTVVGTKWIGGLTGSDGTFGGLKRTYWDMTTSGITDPSRGAGNVANDPGIKGLSDKKLKSGLPRGFDPKIWKEDSSINGGLPYLIANPPAN